MCFQVNLSHSFVFKLFDMGEEFIMNILITSFKDSHKSKIKNKTTTTM